VSIKIETGYFARESSLYPSVQSFLEKRFRCFRAAPRVGTSFVGIADVVGVRDVGGDVRGDVEVVAVEVKMTTSNFGKIMGQALGYSLFAHKCYLASLVRKNESFSEEQKELATRLGVGLLEIRRSTGGWKCRESLTSGNHDPQGHQLETLLRRGFRLTRCSFCGFFADSSSVTESWYAALRKKKMYLAWIKADRDLLFSRRRTTDWRRVYLCSDCVNELWHGLALKEETDSLLEQSGIVRDIERRVRKLESRA
jgi:hypothetical protein